MKRVLYLAALIISTNAAMAQDQIKVSDLVDLEERILVKRMNEELTKPGPNSAPAAPVVIMPKAPKIVYPTETLAVYGTSATFYEGQLSMGGRIYTVRTGTPVQGYLVTSVAPQGIELTKSSSAKRGKGKQRQATVEKLYAPLVAN